MIQNVLCVFKGLNRASIGYWNTSRQNEVCILKPLQMTFLIHFYKSL